MLLYSTVVLILTRTKQYINNEKGYLASNRDGGQGNDDIYWFNKKSTESVIVDIHKDSLQGMGSVSVSGTVLTAQNHTPVADIRETLIDEEGHKLKTTRTNDSNITV